MKIRAEPKGSFILQNCAGATPEKGRKNVKNRINVLKNLRGG
jgi:hypothetical protein